MEYTLGDLLKLRETILGQIIHDAKEGRSITLHIERRDKLNYLINSFVDNVEIK